MRVGIAMTQPAWLARAVLYQIDVPDFAAVNGGGLERLTADLDYFADLGVNALALGRCFSTRHGDDASFDALLGAAHARGIRVCVTTSSHAPDRTAREVADSNAGPIRDTWQRAMESWFERGVDGVLVDGAGDVGDPYHVAMHRQWRDLRAWVDEAYPERAVLVAAGHPSIVRDAGFDVDVARPDDARGGAALVSGPNALAAARRIAASEHPRDTDDLKVLFTLLLTWPHVPCIRYGDEIGARDALPTIAALRERREPLWHHVERLIYLRITEADLSAEARSTLIGAKRDRPLAYRRGATLIVVLNPKLTTHVVALPPVGDAVPVLEHHCHASHGANGWQVKIGARGYGVFTVR
jgi:hypothetical protein